MAWSTPLTAVSNSTLTAAQWNASVRDNFLETATAKATAAGRIYVSTGANALAERVPSTAIVDTSETTGSTSFADLTTPGPAVTVTTGARAIVWVAADLANNTVGNKAYMSYAVSGATTQAATDTRALNVRSALANYGCAAAAVFMETGLNSGTNTFTAKYRSDGGTAAYTYRRIVVIPL